MVDASYVLAKDVGWAQKRDKWKDKESSTRKSERHQREAAFEQGLAQNRDKKKRRSSLLASGDGCKDLAVKDIAEEDMGWSQNRGKLNKGNVMRRAVENSVRIQQTVVEEQRRKGLDLLLWGQAQ